MKKQKYISRKAAARSAEEVQIKDAYVEKLAYVNAIRVEGVGPSVAVQKMATIAVDSGLAQYSTSDLEDPDLGEALLQHTLVINEEHEQSSELASVVSALATSLTKIKKDKVEDAKELLESDSFKGLSTDHVRLLHQFVSKRDAFIKTHRLLDAKSIAHLMGIQVNNLPRKMQQLRENNEILFVKMGDAYLYPEFQLDRQGQTYDGLINTLPSMYKAGRTGWDICFWLFNEQSTLIQRPQRVPTLKGKSFEEVMDLGKKIRQQTVYHKGIPIESLRNNEIEIFASQVEDWLAPDKRDVTVRKKALG
jgi:hypothetical protein